VQKSDFCCLICKKRAKIAWNYVCRVEARCPWKD